MVRYLKTTPTQYVMQFKSGQVKREGAGLSFFYWEPTSTLVIVPLSSADVPFAFQESTADFQTITVQGQLTWRVADAKKLASLLDYSVTRDGQWKSDDPRKLEERLVHTAQILTQGVVGKLTLTKALGSSEALAATVLAGLRGSEAVQLLGWSCSPWRCSRSSPRPRWRARSRPRRARGCSARATRRSTSAAPRRWRVSGGSRNRSCRPR